MAKIEDLIGRISDAALRDEIAREVSKLKQTKSFGLVFEEHIPEVVPLVGLPIAVGELVQRRDDPDKRLFRVRAIENDLATLDPLEGDGAGAEVQTDKLQLVKWVGDPVYPALASRGSITCGSPDRPYHAVINGENYQALELFGFMYEGQVDCLYLDPPYNTGAADWKYNNRYVEDTDSWRHSKWLSFMDKRLRLAHRLLKPNGVLVVTIDEHEVHHLGMLLEDLFPTSNYMHHMVTIVHNPKGTYKANFARVDEYAFFVVPELADDVIQPMPRGMFAGAESPEHMERLRVQEDLEDPAYQDYYLRRRGQESGYRHQRPNQFYAILVDEDEERVVGVGPALEKDEEYQTSREGSVVTVYPLDTRNDERVWRYSRETMEDYIEEGEIVVTGHSARTGQGWVLNHRVPLDPNKRLKTVWWERRHDAGMHGSDLLTAFLGDSAAFPFPKSVYAVRDCLDAVVRNRPEALVMDVFAGSGTTLHATCLLNARDEARRRCVLVTNNDVDEKTAKQLVRKGYSAGDPEFEKNGIFESVTMPRTKAVITGRRPDGDPVEGEHLWADRRPYADGFEENVEFFDLTYVDPDQVQLGRQFDSILPALWLAAGGIGVRETGVSDRDFSIPEGCSYAVLFREVRFAAFLDALEERPEITSVYLVTDSEDAYAEMVADLPGHIKSSMLYTDYLRNFRINEVR